MDREVQDLKERQKRIEAAVAETQSHLTTSGIPLTFSSDLDMQRRPVNKDFDLTDSLRELFENATNLDLSGLDKHDDPIRLGWENEHGEVIKMSSSLHLGRLWVDGIKSSEIGILAFSEVLVGEPGSPIQQRHEFEAKMPRITAINFHYNQKGDQLNSIEFSAGQSSVNVHTTSYLAGRISSRNSGKEGFTSEYRFFG